MATIPTIPTEVPGNFWTSALWNANILNGLGYLFAPVRFKAYSSTTQSITSGAANGVVLTLDTEIVDSDGGHSTVTNTSRYTAQTAGLYWVCGTVCFSTSATGARALQILVNGTGTAGNLIQSAATSTNGGSVLTSSLVQLAVGDYVELFAWQTSGGNLTTSTGAANGVNTTMNLFRISS